MEFDIKWLANDALVETGGNTPRIFSTEVGGDKQVGIGGNTWGGLGNTRAGCETLGGPPEHTGAGDD